MTRTNERAGVNVPVSGEIISIDQRRGQSSPGDSQPLISGAKIVERLHGGFKPPRKLSSWEVTRSARIQGIPRFLLEDLEAPPR